MASPFPGMDPWLEDADIFPNLHEKLAVYLSESLNAAMPAGYVATIRNRIWIDEDHVREPDVATFGRDRGRQSNVAALPGLIAVGQALASDPVEEPYLQIYSAHGKRLITAIEIISVSNKRAGAKGRKAYRNKQKEYREAGVHLVEIDLLRTGPHVTAVPVRRLQKAIGKFDYHICVSVIGERTQFYAAPVRLSDPLPEIGVPLDGDAEPVKVALQVMLDRAYDTGRYPELVRYDQPCDPPLTEEQRIWAEAILREKGILR
jgi:hypothetical protein